MRADELVKRYAMEEHSEHGLFIERHAGSNLESPYHASHMKDSN